MQKVRLQEVVTYEKPHSYLGAEPGLELTRGSFQDLLLRTSVNLMLVAAQRRTDMQPALMIRDRNETTPSNAGSRKSCAKEGRDGGAERLRRWMRVGPECVLTVIWAHSHSQWGWIKCQDQCGTDWVLKAFG